MYYLRSNPGVSSDQLTVDTDLKLFAQGLMGIKKKRKEVVEVKECLSCQ
jgi:hypothetical protein